MFELEDYSSGYHDAFINKYAETSRPTLDLYISDSLQDMLDIDIRSEISNVVGGNNELHSMLNDLPSSFDHAIDAISSIHNTNGLNSSLSSAGIISASSTNFSWLGNSSGGPSWSSSNDYYADVGACVDPISVMPLISSSLLDKSPKINLNSVNSPPPASPNANETKSHLTFSPAQLKVSAGAMRNEQLYSHIPKQIVAISSTVTAATTAPATMATNSALQRKNSNAVETIKKDLGAELRKLVKASEESKVNMSHSNGGVGGSNANTKSPNVNGTISNSAISGNNCVSSSILNSNGMLNSTTTNTIKLAPGIGGLTFANSIAYNKLKQQTAAKLAQGGQNGTSPNGTIIPRRERDSSPLQNINVVHANGTNPAGSGGQQHVPKLVGRSLQNSSFTPKSIASVHSPLMQNGSNSIGSPSSSSSSSHSSPSTNTTSSSFCPSLMPISVNNGSPMATSSASSASTTAITTNSVKPLQQRIKVAPVESEFPKPAYSYSCLIAMSLKNSRSGSLPVSEIYSFMCEHFPYFRTAPSGWKNSVRHNLSLNKCFEKIEKPATNGNQRKGCLWAMNPERIIKMDEEVQKWSRKDPMGIKNAMVHPDHLEALERGEMKHGSTGDSDIELDSQSEIEETSDLEEHELDDTIVDNMFVEEDIEEEEMLSSGIVINSSDVISEEDDLNGCGASEDVVEMQQHRDFDIEVSLETHKIEKVDKVVQRVFEHKVEDIYDAIDIEDDKEALHNQLAINQPDIIELSPADLNVAAQSPKRARFNINYSIGPTGELEKHIKVQKQHHHTQQQQQKQNQQHLQHHHNNSIQQFKMQPQHIVVQTITNGSNTTSIQAINTATGTTIGSVSGALSSVTNGAMPNNRRKIQLINRIV